MNLSFIENLDSTNKLIQLRKNLHHVLNVYKNDKSEQIGTLLSNIYNEMSVLDPKNALVHLKEALKYSKKNELIYNNIAHNYVNVHSNYKNGEFFYLKALELNPKFVHSYSGINIVYMHTGDHVKQLDLALKAIENIPTDGDMYNNLGVCYIKLDRLEEGLETLKKGIEIEKNPLKSAKMYMNISYIYNLMGQTEDCMTNYLKSIKDDPNHALTYHNMLLCLHYFKDIPDSLKQFQFHVEPSFEYTVKDIDFYHRFIAEILYKKKYNPHSIKKGPKSNGKIRIGYVSGDALNHAVSMFVHPLFNLYDSDKFEIYLYSTKYTSPEKISQIGKNINYRHIQNYNTDKACDVILSDSIDKLIDLSGYTAETRLDIFAKFSYLNTEIDMYTFLGYPDNTGIKNVIRISDEFTEQFSTNTEYTKTLKMPRIFLCFKPMFEIQITKKKVNGFEDCIVLGSFSKLQKINQEVIDTWDRIIEELTSRGKKVVLFLKGKVFNYDANVVAWRKKFKHGDKVYMFKHTENYANHLDLYNVLDLELDTWPYSGTTITCESLYMNTPVVTYCPSGSAHVSRVSASVLHEMGFSDYVAVDLDSYVSKAVDIVLREEKATRNIHEAFLKVMEPTRYIREFESLII
jgi:protein O-GlcNAc transferase